MDGMMTTVVLLGRYHYLKVVLLTNDWELYSLKGKIKTEAG